MQPQQGGGLRRWIRLTLMDPWQVLGTVALLGTALAMAVMVSHVRHPPHVPKTGPPVAAVPTPSPQASFARVSPDPSPASLAQGVSPPDPRVQSSPSPRPRATPRPTIKASPTPTPVRPPLAILHLSSSSATARATLITANASGSNGGSAAIISYIFDFGDGTTLALLTSSATHVYQTPGLYTVTLRVTNAAGLSSPDTASILVTP